MGGKTVGIAPKSILFTYNVYPGSNLTLTNLIKSAIQEANEKNLVFQTSIQGKIWWWSAKEGKGDPIKSKEYTKKILDETTDTGNTFFAIAAGNCRENPND